MHFSIQREDLLKPLKAVSGVVERKSTQLLPILSHVLLEVTSDKTLHLTTTDQEVELNARETLKSECSPGRITLPFRKLMDICRALPEGECLHLSTTEDRALIRSRKSRFSLSLLPANEFPSLEEQVLDRKFRLSRSDIRALLGSTCFAMAEQDVRYYLNGMLLELKQGLLFSVAADGHRLAVNSLSVDLAGGELKIILPRKGVIELQRMLEEGEEEISFAIGTNHLRAETNSVSFTTKLLEGRFPDYESIIPRGGDKVVRVGREILKEAFYRAAALFTDKSRALQLGLKSGILKILAETTDQDKVEEEVEVNYQGEALEIGFNAKYLIDFLNVIPTEEVEFVFKDANSSAKVQGVGPCAGKASAVYVIMPMRL